MAWPMWTYLSNSNVVILDLPCESKKMYNEQFFRIPTRIVTAMILFIKLRAQRTWL